jgi:hypothetical protein
MFPSFQPPAYICSRIINDVLKRSVTRAKVGLHPSKGGKGGWVFLRSTISKWVGNSCKRSIQQEATRCSVLLRVQ